MQGSGDIPIPRTSSAGIVCCCLLSRSACAAYDRPPNQNHVLEDLLKLLFDTAHPAEFEAADHIMHKLLNHPLTDSGHERCKADWDAYQMALAGCGEG